MSENTGDKGQKQQKQKPINRVIQIILKFCALEFAKWREEKGVSEEVFETMSTGVSQEHTQKIQALLKSGEKAFPAAAQTYIDLVLQDLLDNGEMDEDTIREFKVKVVDKTTEAISKSEEQTKKSNTGNIRPEDVNPYKRDEVRSLDKFLSDVKNDQWEEKCRIRLLAFLDALTGDEPTNWAQTLAKPGDHRDKFALIVRQPDVNVSKNAAKSQNWI